MTLPWRWPPGFLREETLRVEVPPRHNPDYSPTAYFFISPPLYFCQSIIMNVGHGTPRPAFVIFDTLPAE